MKSKPGKFIVFEGADGVGKSTQVKLLSAYLRKKKYPVISTFEPGDTWYGKKIRSLLLHSKGPTKSSKNESKTKPMSPICELFLYLADRAEHIDKCIRPHLRKGYWVICDRFTDSTLVYQGVLHGLEPKALQYMNHFVSQDLKPDITFILDVSLRERSQRLGDRQKLNQMDRLALHHKINRAFLDLKDTTHIVINSSFSIEHVHAFILQILEKKNFLL